MRKQMNHLECLKKFRDGDSVVVGFSLDKAITLLRAKCGRHGTRVILKFRRDNPGRGARKMAKRKKSLKRYIRALEKNKRR
jgi:hypothetical protein